ncbi:MAG: glycine cleavage system aminomethyltransferase T/glycine [Gammaproteobacteria bacterium]|jgi:glycine cleavage system aminomethyltransferase T/glycine/D-amino acid oxidase-like deaminating enzyme
MSESTSLPSHAEAIVIGGGVMGCSTAYHLAKLGLKDTVLLERNQLTSGTTWHSAAQVRQIRSTRNLTRLIQYSARLYSELEAETGQQTGWNQTGSLSIATNPDRWSHVRRQSALARAFGVETREVTREELQSFWPLLNTNDVIGAVFSPGDGRVNPSDLCQALVKGARVRGARVFENTPVTGFLRQGSRVVGVITDKGEVRADKVVICGGLWSRDLAGKAGVTAPLLPCEHFYLLTKPIEGIHGHLPSLSDHDGHLYIRDDVGGLLVGCFEPKGKPLDPAALGEDFAFSLLNEDWDHFEPMMLNALHRIPALETAEIRTLLNGPESFTPDSSFMLGESTEAPGLFLGCGMNSVGIATGGGAGWALAQWMVDGAAPFHLGEADPSRFHGVENTLAGLMARAPEVLGRHYEISYPGRQFESARDLRHGPLHDRFITHKARFAQVFGWERPQYFGCNEEPTLTFDRPAWFTQVGEEVSAATQAAAIFDQSTFGKIEVRGSDAEAFLDRVCANDMRRAPGRAVYTAMLNERGGFESDLTALRLADAHYRLYVGTTAIKRDLAWLNRQLDEGEQVTLTDVTQDYAVLAFMGPDALCIAQDLGAGSLANIGYFHHEKTSIAGVKVRAARLSYVGEAGWELTCAASDAVALFDALVDTGARPAGLLAQTSMRIEKRYLAMGHDLDGDVTPIEAGLEFALGRHGGFIGAEAVAARRAAGSKLRMTTIVIDDPGANPLGDEPVYQGDELIGQVTSAAFGYRVGRPVALAYLAADRLTVIKNPNASGESERGIAVELDVAGKRVSGRAQLGAAFDPSGTRIRGN